MQENSHYSQTKKNKYWGKFMKKSFFAKYFAEQTPQLLLESRSFPIFAEQ